MSSLKTAGWVGLHMRIRIPWEPNRLPRRSISGRGRWDKDKDSDGVLVLLARAGNGFRCAGGFN